MPRKIAKLTNERNKTHGNFEDVAAASRGLVAVLEKSPNWSSLSETRKESIFLICHKLARIASGNPNHADHWDDIGGYAELGKNDGQYPKEPAASLRNIAAARKAIKANRKKVKARPAKKAKSRVGTTAARSPNKTRTARVRVVKSKRVVRGARHRSANGVAPAATQAAE